MITGWRKIVAFVSLMAVVGLHPDILVGPSGDTLLKLSALFFGASVAAKLADPKR